MSTIGSTKDVNDSRAEAIQALLNSLAPSASGQASGEGKLTEEQVRKISDKLGEIFGDQVDEDGDTRRNEKGELVNEEGLPIIDITEPIPPDNNAPSTHQISNFDDPDLLPLWALSPEEKARRKAERERILDALEEEERLEQLREAEIARAKWREEMDKRKEAQKTEMENLKRARELQKKMGRALVRSVIQSREEEEEKRKAELAQADQKAAAARKASSLKPKKSVTFADEHQDIEEGASSGAASKGKAIDWGDVVPARLRPIGQGLDRTPMKMHVVERHPKAFRAPVSPIPQGDSDDEDGPGSMADADSDTGEVVHSDHSSEDGGQRSPPQSESDEDSDLPPDEGPGDWGTDDFDYARHQREVALEYYEKRQTIGAEVASAMRSHSHDDNDWDQPEVPLEASLAAVPKSSTSRFKAEHMTPSTKGSTLASHSLGQSVLPAAQSTSLRRAVRMGKLEDGKLVGGEEGDSDGEVDMADENTRTMLEMLRNGQVTNMGPKQSAASKPDSRAADISSEQVEPEATESTSRPIPTKTSKFKMSLGDTASAVYNPPLSGTESSVSTPIDAVTRSSPKVTSPPPGTPVGPFTPAVASTSITPQTRVTGKVIESPDFPRPINAQMPSMIIESPDFARPGSIQMPSMIVESPDFPRPSGISSAALSPTSTVVPSTVASVQASPVAVTPLRPSVVERRPPTIASAKQTAVDSQEQQGVKQKVSRFKAQRGQ